MPSDKKKEYEKLRESFIRFLDNDPDTRISGVLEGLQAGVDYKPVYIKYGDWEKMLQTAFNIAHELELHRSSSLKILDIGCGAGYFPWVCSHYGHLVTGLDFPSPLFGNLRQLFKVECVEKPVHKKEPLPLDATGFDWIVALNTQFHREEFVHQQGVLRFGWKLPEWDFFIKDCLSKLAPEGKLYFKLNDAEATKTHLPAFFLEQGTWLKENQVIFGKRALSSEIS